MNNIIYKVRQWVAIAIATAAFGGQAATSWNDGVTTWVYNPFGDGVSLHLVAPRPSGELVIPEQVDGLPVRSIEYHFCYENKDITSLRLPSTLRNIDDSAFHGCTKLQQISFPSSVTNIGDNAFRDCRFSSLDLPNELVSIGKYAFYQCNRLTSVRMGGKLKTLGANAFAGCISLLSATMSEGLETIGAFAFDNCTSLRELSIPSTVTHIGMTAFYSCAALTSVTYYGSLPELENTNIYGGSTSENMPKCTSYVRLPTLGWDSALTAGTWCGRPVRGIASANGYTWECVMSDGKAVLTGAGPRLAGAVTIPSSIAGLEVGGIAADAFANCSEVTSVDIPASVRTVGIRAFYTCENLTSVRFHGAKPTFDFPIVGGQWITLPMFYVCTDDASSWATELNEGKLNGATLIGLDASGGYTWSYNIQNEAVELTGVTPSPSGHLEVPAQIGGYPVVRLGNSLFRGCDSLTSVNLPDGITEIGKYVFAPMAIDRLVIPASVTNIEMQALSSPDLRTIYFYGDVPNVGYDVLGNNSSKIVCIMSDAPSWLEPLALGVWQGASITRLASEGGGSLAWKYRIENGNAVITGSLPEPAGSVDIPSVVDGRPVVKIDEDAFASAERLTEVSLPASLRELGDGAFYWATGLETVDIAPGVTNIGDLAFSHCESLSEIRIPGSVVTIGSCAFESCGSLASVEIEAGVRSIGGSAFLSCASLTELTIPNGVERLGFRMVAECQNLRRLTFLGDCPETVENIGPYLNMTVHVKPNRAGWGADLLGYTVVVDAEDNFEDAAVLNGTTGSIRMSNLGSTTQAGDPLTQGYGTESTVWWTWTAPLTGNMSITLTDATFAESVLGVYTGTSLSEGLSTVCETSSAASDGSCAVEFSCSAGTTYRIECAGVDSARGDFSLVWQAAGITDGSSGYTWFYDLTDSGEAILQGSSPKLSLEVILPSMIEGHPVVGIEQWVFSDCDSLEILTVPNSVRDIGQGAFWGCDGLKSLFLGESVTNIAERAFESCASLGYVSIPGSVEVIGRSAFGYDTALASVDISDGVRQIANNAFTYSGLESICIPGSVSSIGQSAFVGCASLSTVEIQPGVGDIGMYAFEHCENLSSVTLGVGVTNIGNSAFSDCALEAITIPTSVTSIGWQAFASCAALTNVIFMGNKPVVDETMYLFTSEHLVTRVSKSATGWNSDVENGSWCGRPIVWLDNGPSPIGYAAWAAEKGLTGVDAAWDAKPSKWGGEWANAFIYTYGEGLAGGTLAIMNISFDVNGKPVITTTPVVEGHTDFTPAVIGTPNLQNWTSPVMLENKSGNDWTLPAGKSAHFFRVRLSE